MFYAQILSIVSQDPVARAWPLGATPTHDTLFSCPVSWKTYLSVAPKVSHPRQLKSSYPANKIRPLFEKEVDVIPHRIKSLRNSAIWATALVSKNRHDESSEPVPNDLPSGKKRHGVNVWLMTTQSHRAFSRSNIPDLCETVARTRNEHVWINFR